MRSFTRSLWITFATVVLTLTLIPAAQAGSRPFPGLIDLPIGWQPEGIAAGRGTTVYVGSLVDGAVWKADIRTGQGQVLVDGVTGRVAVGLEYAGDRLYVAGGRTGQAYVYDAQTGNPAMACQLTSEPAFINDVVVTRDAAYFTNSLAAELYRLPIGGGADCDDVDTIELTGDWQQVTGFNANGIDATPNGRTLLVVNTTLGAVYTVDARTGVATEISLPTGVTLTMGDGILLEGRTLFVVRNRSNEIVELKLSGRLTSAQVVDTLTDPDFAVPTTIASFGGTLYAVNARFGVASPETQEYHIVRVNGAR